VAVLVSGTGSILDAMVEAGVPVALVVADRPCLALDRAAMAGIATELVARDSFDASFDRDAYSARLAQVLERLDPGGLETDAGLEHLAGCLAGPEAGQAHLTSDATEGGVEILLELLLLDRDGQLDLVALEGFNR
jgi:hypothetical protein